VSEDIGPALPPPLRFELGAHSGGDAAQATLLLTVDLDGAQRVAVLSPAELSPRDASHVMLRLQSGSTACANIMRTGQGALWYVLDAAAYCIRGTISKITPEVCETDYESFELTITSVLRDFHPQAPMVSGATYRRL
jgi:hypothetical protein